MVMVQTRTKAHTVTRPAIARCEPIVTAREEGYRMETPPTQRRSLTAWLASAAADRGGPAPQPSAKAARVDDDHPRCIASVVSGQRCPRRAAAGGDLCSGHAAMAGKPVVKLPATG